MSQLGSTGATVSGNLTAWNRTPGKPGTGGSGGSAFQSNRWPSTKSSSNTEGKRDLNTDEHLDKLPLGPSDSAPNLWPSLFDSQRLTAEIGQGESTSQWTSSAFSGPTASNTLLTSSDGANPSSSSNWPMHSTLAEPSTIPRAITGQQLINHSALSIDSTDPSRRFLVGSGSNMWPLNSDAPDTLNDDSSQLSMALSKMNMSSTPSTGSCFQPIHDFNETSNLPTGEATADPLDRTSTSLENPELEALVASDPEEAMRAVINTPKPWGVRPVDQSTPWDLSELTCDTAVVTPTSTDINATAGRMGGAHSSNLFEGTQPSRRIGGREMESNVWPSEPPNGTGIWEAYYESLGERTARWQPNLGSSTGTPSGFPGQQSGFAGTSFPAGPRTHDHHLGGGGNSFRNLMRPNMGPLLGNSGAAKPHPTPNFHGAPSPTGSSRAFPIAGNTNPWPFPSGPVTPDSVIGGKGRWPNANFNRTTGRHQPPVAHLLSGQGGNGLRWPPMNNPSQFSAGWPLNDPRRPNMLPGNWSGSSASADQVNYFGSGHPFPPPTISRMCQPGNEFANPLPPPCAAASARGPTVGGGGAPNQAFRLSNSAFYPSVAQRAFLSPQQHSQQLQQQSVLRANAMRQLIQLGFPDDEVQAIFSDINTNVERALIDLRDRTCHPGLDEIIRSLATGNLMSMNTGPEDSLCADMAPRPDLLSTGAAAGGMRSLGMRPGSQHASSFDQSLSKSGNLPNENLDLSIHVLQQRETQVLQTIMQLQSKHQELNQRLAQIRSTNMPFGTNPVMQELQLQAIQVASQIDAQHAQLKQVRSQTGMLKHLASVANVTQAASNLSLQTTNSAFTPPPPPPSLSGGLWMSTTSATGHSLQLNEQQLDQGLDTQDPILKLGSGSLMWETGPWSGLGPRSVTSAASGSFDSYASSDRRWSSTALPPNRPNYIGALGDPRWSDLGTDTGATNFLLQSTNTDLNSEDPNANRRTGSRSWLLAHNIPPHVSGSVLKMAVSAALAKQTKSGGGSGVDTHSTDFELHPNMSARWVLIGLANPTDAVAVQEYLESSGGEQNGAHYGSIKAISPADALLRLQDIQSLASRFKAFSNNDQPSARGSTQPTGNLTSSFPNPSTTAAASGDFAVGDAINRPVGETN